MRTGDSAGAPWIPAGASIAAPCGCFVRGHRQAFLAIAGPGCCSAAKELTPLPNGASGSGRGLPTGRRHTPQVPPNPIVTLSPSTMTGTCRWPFE